MTVVLAGCTMETEEVGKKSDTEALKVTYDGSTKEGAAPPAPSAPPTKAPAAPPKNEPTRPMNANMKTYATPPAMLIDSERAYMATLKTDLGDIVVSLDAKEVPATANNFVFLAREKFYDNTIFHRTLSGFMIQGGDPEGTGMGGPGYKFPDEPIVKDYRRGTIAMANSGKNTNGSQFFIMHADYPLPKNYVIFGEVVSGMEVVDKIATAPVTMSGGGEQSKPVTPITVRTVEISETAPQS
jgi:cyclophilin family peptidyl-prolyl cis-trans isomerase